MLLLDVGNSRCKWALVENGVWLRQGALDNADWPALRNTLAALPAPRLVRISNVAGEAMAQRLRELCVAWPCTVQFALAQDEQCGVRNLYERPAQLGSDRWLALVAAWQKVGAACLVVNFGTATTVDALSERGEFLGGLILPGLALMRASLASNTAQLEISDGKPCEFPRNTADAIFNGVMHATIGAVRHQFDVLAARQKTACIISGGAAAAMQPYLGIPCERVDNLVLHGLHITGQEIKA
jgi:type III pantothenate kinase